MNERTQRALGGILLVLITIPLLAKIFTSDFGTHIAMGREIVRTRSIPDKEFLNHPSLGMPNPNAEWGFQALLYLVHASAGSYGVSFLCWAVAFGIHWLLYRAALIRGSRPLVAVLAIFAFSGFLRIRIQPRPEIFTYLFTAWTLYLFTEYFFGKRKKLVYLFPGTVLAWANMHPAYLMGFVLGGAFLADALLRAAWRGEFRWSRLKEWIGPPIAVVLLGLALCGLNPYGYDAIMTPLHLLSRGGAGGGSPVLMSIAELVPVMRTGLYGFYKAAALFAAISLLLGVIGRRVCAIDIFLFAIAFKGGWDSARAVSMIGLFVSPGSSLQLTGFLAKVSEWFPHAAIPEARTAPNGPGREERQVETASGPLPAAGRGRIRLARGPAAITAAVAAALLFFGGATLAFTFSQLQFGIGITEHKFSFAAADFLRKNPVPGKMFNFFDVGGFLNWQLYPQVLTFIDGRTYNKEIFLEHQRVTGALPGWQDVLRRHGITHIVTKTQDSSGTVLPLIFALYEDPDWSLVFADGLFVVFVRKAPERQDYFREHEIPKSRLIQQIIDEAYHYMYLGLGPVIAYSTISGMYEVAGNRPAAIMALREGLERKDHPYLRARLMELERAASGSPAPGIRR